MTYKEIKELLAKKDSAEKEYKTAYHQYLVDTLSSCGIKESETLVESIQNPDVVGVVSIIENPYGTTGEHPYEYRFYPRTKKGNISVRASYISGLTYVATADVESIIRARFRIHEVV